jgi:hypothetical protein
MASSIGVGTTYLLQKKGIEQWLEKCKQFMDNGINYNQKKNHILSSFEKQNKKKTMKTYPFSNLYCSFNRPVTLTKPSSACFPKSPVWNIRDTPSGAIVITSAVASGLL